MEQHGKRERESGEGSWEVHATYLANSRSTVCRPGACARAQDDCYLANAWQIRSVKVKTSTAEAAQLLRQQQK